MNMNQFLNTKRWKRHIQTNLRGSGGMYVLLILGLVAGLSYLLTGGLTPNIERSPENPQFVEIEDQVTPIAQQNLQMQNLRAKPTNTPTPTPSNTPTPTNTPIPTNTPTPTPTSPPATPTPTNPVVACLDNTAIALLVDLSYSMAEPATKLSALNSALNLLNSRLTEETVVGAYAFGPYPDYNNAGDLSFNFENNKGVKQLLPFRRYSENQSAIDSQLGGLRRGGVGGTYMRNGFQVMTNKIREAKQAYPGYEFVTILLSDGVPELGDDDPVVQDYWSRGLGFPVVTCAGNKCFAKHQDPRAWSDIGTSNLITPLRNESKDQIVYTIALYGTAFPDNQLITHLEDLLVDIAGSSSSPQYQYINTTNFSQLSSFFTRILNDTCS